MVKTSASSAGAVGSISGQGARILVVKKKPKHKKEAML